MQGGLSLVQCSGNNCFGHQHSVKTRERKVIGNFSKNELIAAPPSAIPPKRSSSTTKPPLKCLHAFPVHSSNVSQYAKASHKINLFTIPICVMRSSSVFNIRLTRHWPKGSKWKRGGKKTMPAIHSRTFLQCRKKLGLGRGDSWNR